MRKRPVILLLISAALLAVFTGLSALAYGGSTDEKPKAPASLTGEWHQTGTGAQDVIMKASIKPGSIQINMKTRDFSTIYWLGTFDAGKDTSKPFKIVSQGDQDAMKMSIFGSQSKTKTFSYENGQLSYKFTMMGTTTTVRLSKI